MLEDVDDEVVVVLAGVEGQVERQEILELCGSDRTTSEMRDLSS
jgi:hypothetical protein